MFEIKSHRSINTDLPIITGNYLELLADENPILYTGTNKYGNRILGIIVEESDENFSIRYFHVIIEDKAYYRFTNKLITLRELIEKTNNIFVLDYKTEQIQETYLVPIDEIPGEYLPLSDSYCPDIVFVPG